MGDKDLRFYDSLSALGRPKSYEGKIFLVAFIGTHIPLLALIFYALNSVLTVTQKFRVLLVGLGATLLGAAGTLYAVHRLLEPIKRASRSLQDYIEDDKKPNLPTHYTDEAGQLMADTQLAIERLDSVIGSLQKVSSSDHLTSLYNRRAGEERLAQDIARARRADAPFSLAMIDVDNFKRINDRYGHATGDLALRSIAAAAGVGIRAGDWAARWGGDEFVIGLYGAGKEAADAAMERLLVALGEKPLHTSAGEEITLSISLGVSQLDGDKDDANRLFERTDAALLGAKRLKGLGDEAERKRSAR